MANRGGEITSGRTAPQVWATEWLYRIAAATTPYDAWSHLQERLRAPWQPIQELRPPRWDRLQGLLEHCWEHVPFYRTLWSGAGVDPRRFTAEADLRHLPTVDRAMLSRGRQEGAFGRPERVQSLRTSGTTAESFELWIGLDAYQKKYANHLRQHYAAGWRLGMRSAALHYSGHPHFRGRYSGNTSQREPWQGLRELALALAHRKKMLTPYSHRSTGDDSIPASWYRDLKRHRPFLLDTFHVNLLLLADYIEREGLEPPTIPAIFVLASLSSRERERLGKPFGSEIFNRYSPHECEGIAFACHEHRGLHVAIDCYEVEITDREGEPLPADDTGWITVTDLENLSMPLVRYRIGDLGRMQAEPCPCGRSFPLMADLEGRAVDVLGPDPLGATPARVEQFFQGDERIRLFQVSQSGQGVAARVVPKAPGILGTTWESACHAHLRNLLGDGLEIRIEEVTSLELEPNGKFSFVKRTDGGGEARR